jgi:DNA phosphorothioation-dependent restriction protein DptH
MNALSMEVTAYVTRLVADELSRLADARAELRIFFHGPPLAYLEEVLGALISAGMKAKTADGAEFQIPILLQVPSLPKGSANPLIGESGKCDESHLMALRNSPSCRQYLVLVPPGLHRNLSITSASSEFGLAATANSNNATFDDWSGDPFVQHLIERALDKLNVGTELEDARKLVLGALSAVESVAQEEPRCEGWNLFSRLFSGTSGELSGDPGLVVCLACGFPPSRARLNAQQCFKVLGRLADELAGGYKAGVQNLKQNTDDAEDWSALDEFLGHLEVRGDLLTAFERSPSAFYGPCWDKVMAAPPEWWRHLTVEKWLELFEEEQAEKDGLALVIKNSLVGKVKGGCAVVANGVELAITNSSGQAAAVFVERFHGGRGQARASWTHEVEREFSFTDDEISEHKAPIRYVATSPGYRAASLKLISLRYWLPGVYVVSRTAVNLKPTKQAKPNREKVALECYMHLTGPGRHYIDLYVSPGVTVSEAVSGRDAAGEEVAEDNLTARIELVSEQQLGFEIDLPGDCYLDLTISRAGVSKAELLRVHLTCEDVAPSNCNSEFERAIALNRQEERGKGRYEVYVDRHARRSDLQAWLLDASDVARSFVPIVLAQDYAVTWAPPRWSGEAGPIFSLSNFLHDPRPLVSDFAPSARFVEARLAIAARIRGADGNGLVEEAPLGEWMHRDIEFSQLVETYLDEYAAWLSSEPTVAAWADVVLVASASGTTKTLDQEPDAIILSPIHPLRLAWHCAAQGVLLDAVRENAPCPAASILDPDSIPDSFPLPLRQADGSIVYRPFISVEVDTDYWGVLWNGSRLSTLEKRSSEGPFGADMGIQVGGVSSGFSSAQVMRALDDTHSMFAAKSRLAVLIASSGSNSTACTDGVIDWAKNQWTNEDPKSSAQVLGPRLLEVYDTRSATHTHPDDACISNLTEDTAGAVKWFSVRPSGSVPDVGIIAQLESSQPMIDDRSDGKSPISAGGLIRHRVRRQLPGGASAFLSESRQARVPAGRSDSLHAKLSTVLARLENLDAQKISYSFAPNVNAIRNVLTEQKAVLVAVSSSTIDPACFLGQWLQGAYLWDYDLPSFSRRAGDTNGYYLISQVRDAEREGLSKALARLPGAEAADDTKLRDTLLEVARRGIPTVRGLSGMDTTGTGNLGVFIASRLLQDEFRSVQGTSSLLPVLEGQEDERRLALVIPIDPFRSYLDDMARSLKRDKKDGTLSRPDLMIVGVRIVGSSVRVKLTPVEVKCRQTSVMAPQACQDALRQARALSELLAGVRLKGQEPGLLMWKLAFQHLVLSMIAFGMRVYSQRIADGPHSRDWSRYHEQIADAVFGSDAAVEIDASGRLIAIDKSQASGHKDFDGDGFAESVVLTLLDAGEIVNGNPAKLYALVKKRIADWRIFPEQKASSQVKGGTESPSLPATRHEPTAAEVNRTQVGQSAQSEKPSASVENSSAVVSHLDTTRPQPVEGEEAGVVLEVGSSIDEFETAKRTLNLSDTRLNQLNIGVVGDLGTGKTQLLKSLIYQLVKSPGNAGVKPRVLIFDYKKDYSSDDFVAAVGAKVVRPHKLPINIFDTVGLDDSATPWLDRFSFFADVLDKIYTGIGPVQRANLKQAVRRAYESAAIRNSQPTLSDVHAEYGAMLAGKLDSPFAIIDDLIDRQIFSTDADQSGAFGEFFDGVVVISLNALGQDDRAKNMVVAAMLNLFYEHMLKIPKRPFRGENPQLRTIDSYLLVDEADNIMQYEFDVLKKILLQGREFGAGVILASQYLKHFKVNASDYREPLLTWFVHKVPNVSAQELGGLGLTADVAELAARVKSLPNHHCLYKSAQVGGEIIFGTPFYRLLAG